MWNKSWSLAEGLAIGGGLIVTGSILQCVLGRINWDLFCFPINIIILVGYLFFIWLCFILRRKVYLFQWMCHYSAAITALLWTVAVTLVMGLIKQIPPQNNTSGFSGFSQMLSCWSFVLIYLWLVTILGVTVLNNIYPFRWRKIPFILNHLGLFIAMVCATLGNADMQKLTMTTRIGKPEWRAVDREGKIHELDLAIELQNFTIDEYPPKLMIISNETGKALPEKSPQHILLEKGVTSGNLPDWKIEIKDMIEDAAVATVDTINYAKWGSVGSTCVVYVRAENKRKNKHKEGWVSCGSFLFPYQALRLDSISSLVMPEREPERFESTVKVYTKKGKELENVIEVNKPLEVEGWKIYQLSYDESKGKWSDISVFELVKDPWLPFVYIGIGMMILGALCTFVTAQKKKGGERV